jgi:pyruvate,orthophosphate dikinase
MPRYVYDFVEGNKDLKDLLGGKGANLAEMTRMGLPVPPGFTITTEACREYLRTGRSRPGCSTEVEQHLRLIEQRPARPSATPRDPLLLSVRSGGKFSMPGMMETILDIGLNDTSVLGLAAQSGDDRFAWDSYRRLIQMFGKTVCDVPGDEFEAELTAARAPRRDVRRRPGRGRPAELVEAYKKVFHAHTGRDFPQARTSSSPGHRRGVPSWNAERAVLYRRQERIPQDLGTAVNVMAMVFGNRGADSGTGVAFTRDPATGGAASTATTWPTPRARTWSPASATPWPAELQRLDPAQLRPAAVIMAALEERYRDLCDIEFTIERGKLWMLQTRVGKRTAAAAFVIAAQLVDEGTITLDEALRRVTGAQLAQLMFPSFDPPAARAAATGVPASPGAAVGASSSTPPPPPPRPGRSSWSAGRPTPTTCPA